MGGGVSLGTFCGAALTQAIKLALVHGRDQQGEPYDRVEIDVFSGASAGALSLCAMLRSLAEGDIRQEQQALDSLRAEFKTALAGLDAERMRDLVAAQIAQLKQEELWSREIKLDALLGEGGDGRLRSRASILDRGAVDRIAQRHIVNWPGGRAEFSRRRLLADRVLYACTLSNLTPIVVDATDSLPGHKAGYVGLADGLRSHSHRDLRVFDLHFVREQNPEDASHPERWCRYHRAAERRGTIGDLREPRSWAKIAATAIASGAFPGAFEPVVLRRRAYEYGRRLWCRTFGIREADYDPAAEFLFTYADGGMFNNEPIREAFRLASFIDGHRPDDGGRAVERLIVFVDPFISPETPAFNLPIHRQWALEEPNIFGSLDGHDLRRRNSLDRLLPHLGTLLGAVSNESRTIETDRIAQVRDVFALRSAIRASLDGTLATNTPTAEYERLRQFIVGQLSRSKQEEMIPAGPLTLEREMERVVAEESTRELRMQPPPPNPMFTPLRGRAGEFLRLANPSQSPQAATWLRVLAFAALDLVLGLEGKNEGARLVAIAPFRDLEAALASGRRPPSIDLPGGRLGGFAGFMSDIPDQLEFRVARRCAAEFLRDCGVLDRATPLPDGEDFTLPDTDWRKFREEVNAGLQRLSERVAQMLNDSHLIQVFPGVDALLRKLAAQIAKRAVSGLEWEPHERTTVELRVRVPNQRFELDGRGPFGGVDSEPVEMEFEGEPAWFLVTLAIFDHCTGTWSGGFVTDGALDVDEDGTLMRADKDFCTITLPTRRQVELARQRPTALFSLELKGSDRGTALPPERWQVGDGVRPLEDELMG